MSRPAFSPEGAHPRPRPDRHRAALDALELRPRRSAAGPADLVATPPDSLGRTRARWTSGFAGPLPGSAEMSARKIGFLILILLFGGVVELSWNLRESRYSFGPEGLRVLGGRFYGPSFEFEEIERASPALRGVDADRGAQRLRRGAGGPRRRARVQVRLRKVVFRPTEEKARTFAERIELQVEEDEGRLRVGTNREAVEGSEDVGFETHLELRVPSDTAIEVRNRPRGGGGARHRQRPQSAPPSRRASGVHRGPGEHRRARRARWRPAGLGADLTLEARHGDVEVSGVAGQADLDVQHGGLSVRGWRAVKARVSYGDVEVEESGRRRRVDARRGGPTRTARYGRGPADVQGTRRTSRRPSPTFAS